jgi:glycosyltransferase involved in cell wall biosynthesis
MPEVPLQLAAGATLAIWLYLALFRGGFWREFVRSMAPPPGPISSAPRIVAVVPARDEADVVARSIGSLAAQAAPGYFHIVLVDDHSSDGTAAAASAAEGDLLTVIPARPLPPSWKGKLWAVAEGVRHAATICPDYLLLTDADIVHAPVNVAHLAARAGAEGSPATRPPKGRSCRPSSSSFFCSTRRLGFAVPDTPPRARRADAC